jgi:hypothetical protein
MSSSEDRVKPLQAAHFWTGLGFFSGSGSIGSARPLPTSNTYYLAGTNLDSAQEWVLDVPEGMSLSVIVK